MTGARTNQLARPTSRAMELLSEPRTTRRRICASRCAGSGPCSVAQLLLPQGEVKPFAQVIRRRIAARSIGDVAVVRACLKHPGQQAERMQRAGIQPSARKRRTDSVSIVDDTTGAYSA